MADRCADCRYYRAEPGEPYGVCRRFPPQVVATVAPDGAGGIRPLIAGSSQPITQPDHWCGEWTVALTIAHTLR